MLASHYVIRLSFSSPRAACFSGQGLDCRAVRKKEGHRLGQLKTGANRVIASGGAVRSVGDNAVIGDELRGVCRCALRTRRGALARISCVDGGRQPCVSQAARRASSQGVSHGGINPEGECRQFCTHVVCALHSCCARHSVELCSDTPQNMKIPYSQAFGAEGGCAPVPRAQRQHGPSTLRSRRRPSHLLGASISMPRCPTVSRDLQLPLPG